MLCEFSSWWNRNLIICKLMGQGKAFHLNKSFSSPTRVMFDKCFNEMFFYFSALLHLIRSAICLSLYLWRRNARWRSHLFHLILWRTTWRYKQCFFGPTDSEGWSYRLTHVSSFVRSSVRSFSWKPVIRSFRNLAWSWRTIVRSNWRGPIFRKIWFIHKVRKFQFSRGFS